MNPAAQILSFFIPFACGACSTCLPFGENHFLCLECQKALKKKDEVGCVCCGNSFPNEVASHICGDCLTSPPAFEWARSVFELEPTILKLIHSHKYQASSVSVGWFAQEMNKFLDDMSFEKDWDFIVPVPLHPWRLVKRGFNQSLQIARVLGRLIQVPVDFKNLKRRFLLKPQSSLTREARLTQLKNAFYLQDFEVFKDKKILLIDDVYTTGSTLKECAKVLKKAGACVYALTVARTPRLR